MFDRVLNTLLLYSFAISEGFAISGTQQTRFFNCVGRETRVGTQNAFYSVLYNVT